MHSCQFCKIVDRSIKSEILYETESSISFLDHRTVSKGHALVISKRHFQNILDVDEETMCDVMKVAKGISARINDIYHPAGINLIQNNGELAGQTVFHFHVHVIPRYDDDYNRRLGIEAQKRVKVPASNLEMVAEELRGALTGRLKFRT